MAKRILLGVLLVSMVLPGLASSVFTAAEAVEPRFLKDLSLEPILKNPGRENDSSGDGGRTSF
jgi:hypothetical protein